MHTQRGDVAIYMALMIMMIMLSSALTFSLILARQIRATEDVVESERSFYAANTGLENMLYALTKGTNDEIYYDASLHDNQPLEKSREILYRLPAGGTEIAPYTVQGKFRAPDSYCVRAEGKFRNETRRLQLGPADCWE